jgi:hypothetical protein
VVGAEALLLRDSATLRLEVQEVLGAVEMVLSILPQTPILLLLDFLEPMVQQILAAEQEVTLENINLPQAAQAGLVSFY